MTHPPLVEAAAERTEEADAHPVAEEALAAAPPSHRVPVPHPLAVGGAARGIARPWLVGIALALVLGILDRMVSSVAPNAVLDVMINVVGFAGLVLAARTSVRALRRGEEPAHRIGLRTMVYGAGFIGPMLATVALSFAARSVDGSAWMLFSPAIGVLLVGISLLLGRRLP